MSKEPDKADEVEEVVVKINVENVRISINERISVIEFNRDDSNLKNAICTIDTINEKSDFECWDEQSETVQEDPPEKEIVSEISFVELSSTIFESFLRMLDEHESKLKIEEELKNICTDYISVSKTDLQEHPYFFYPSITDPGIYKALYNDQPPSEYSDSGQEIYIDMCKSLNVIPNKYFYEGLLTSEIDLMYCGINSASVRAMCEALMDNTTVTMWDLTDNWLSTDACYHIGELIITNTTLTFINLTGCRIGVDGLKRIIVGLMETTTLTEVRLPWNRLSDAGMEILAPCIAESTCLTIWDLSNNKIAAAGAIQIKRAIENESCNITELNLSWNYIESTVMEAILKVLTKKKYMINLNISWNGLSGENFGVLLQNVLSSCKSLEIVDVSNNLLGSENLVIMSTSIPHAKNLNSIFMGYNKLTSDGALAILDSFASPKTVCNFLDLGRVCVSQEFVKKLAEMENIMSRSEAQVEHGEILGNYTIVGPNMKLIVLKRAQFVGQAQKKNKKNFAEFVLKLKVSLGNEKITVDKFSTQMKSNGIILDENLTKEMIKQFTIESNKINVDEMVELVLSLWPETVITEDIQKKSKEKGNEEEEGNETGKENGNGKKKGKGKEKAKGKGKKK